MKALEMSDVNYGRILRRHGSSVDGYVLDEDEFEAAVKDAIEQGVAQSVPTEITIDYAGRIWFEGYCVGWLNKDAPRYELMQFAGFLGSSLPIVEDMAAIDETIPAVRG